MVRVFDGLAAGFSASNRQLVRLLLIASLVSLGGCASEPPVMISSYVPEAEAPVYKRLAPYNKPYKVKGKTYTPLPSAVGYKATGTASWYGAESGNRTASGARFRPHGLTAAHKTLPIPSKVRVTNLKTGRFVEVVINDRGPFKGNRLIDLSQGAARQLGISGLAEVSVEYIGDS
ncbi:septal ring lytic transglycosylase RlpA family protein [Methylomonas methanica]|uniref:Endolytic peptidoglycan transglycosylase RlpA n=1 Tax=Methylomonas methanica (strain DSM 25384 / MC09) TaxID=857087 RepID=F9ZVQ4_METMM|nr:septal ring lytic transglycosylase RlpA family protein [Methylomonas methanica]AEF99532.1 rare lipoprotein A [Methylomonas methanica MC09]